MGDRGATGVSKRAMVVGWVLTALPAALMVVSGVAKFVQPPGMMEQMAPHGWTGGRMMAVGAVEIACVVLLLLPRTVVLGAILTTGYLGGAVATHAQVGEVEFVAPVVFGVIVWLGLYLRDARVRALAPLRHLS